MRGDHSPRRPTRSIITADQYELGFVSSGVCTASANRGSALRGLPGGFLSRRPTLKARPARTGVPGARSLRAGVEGPPAAQAPPEAILCDVGIRPHAKALHVDRECALHLAKIALLIGLSKSRSHSAARRPAGAADAMHEVFGLARHVVVHDVRHVRHIDTARCDIGCHQHPMLSLRKAAQCGITL